MAASQIFPRYINTIARVLVYGSIPLLFAAIGTGIAIEHSPYVTGVGRALKQPVPFSHQHHAGKLDIDCRYCHNTVETQPFAGIPDAHTCMSCHSQLFTEAEMLAPVRRAYREESPLLWQRVHDLPDFVYFDHSIHVDRGVECGRCHGDVTGLPLMKQLRTLFMQDCLECHREPGGYLESRPVETGREGVEEGLMPPGRLAPTGHMALTQCSICHR